MSTFSVTTQASQIMLGDQGVVTLYNEGPYTVYLDSNASVSPENGFELAPTGQMTWQAGKQLWAATRLGSSRLRSHPDGYLSDANRASVNKVIYSGQAPGGALTDPILLEIGFVPSFEIRVESRNAGGVIYNPIWVIKWYDDDRNELDRTVTYSKIIGLNNSILVCRGKVKGRYFNVTSLNLPFTTTAPTVTILATSLLQENDWQSYQPLTQEAGSDTGFQVQTGACYKYLPFIVSPVTAARTVYLPQYAGPMLLVVNAVVTAADTFQIFVQDYQGNLVDYRSYALMNGNNRFSHVFNLPSTIPVKLTMTYIAATMTSLAGSISWSQ